MTKKINRRDFIKTSTVIGLGALAGCSLRNRFDIIIKNGLIIDGSSRKPFSADLGIKHNRIAAIGDLNNAGADRIIDAKGLIVSPGFIDILPKAKSTRASQPKFPAIADIHLFH